MVAKQPMLKYMQDLISTVFSYTTFSQIVSSIFSIPYPNDYFLKIPIFFNHLF
jgi:hypothetical protein